MVEVLFGESEAGSMKIAKNKHDSEDADKVICLGFMMDIGDNQIGVEDWWYARRIDQLIDQGKIRIVEDSEKKYARLICQA